MTPIVIAVVSRAIRIFHARKWAGEVGGVKAEGKIPLPITPPTSAREKFVWPARL